MIFYDSLNNHFDSMGITYQSDISYSSSAYANGSETVDLIITNYFLNTGTSTWNTDTTWFDFNLGDQTSEIVVYKGYNTLGYPFTNKFPFITGTIPGINKANSIYAISSNTILLPTYVVGNAVYDSVYQISYSYSNPVYADTFYTNNEHLLIKVILNDTIVRKRLYLMRDYSLR